MTTSTIQRPESRRASSHRRLTELHLPPMFYVRFDLREGPPKLSVSDLPEPEKFHERLAAWLMKQH